MPLSGAVFTVYVWDGVNEQWVATSKTYRTDSTGKIIITSSDHYLNGTLVYAKDTAYCIKETAAPAGYILPADPPPFYFWFSEHETEPLSCPDDFMDTAANVSVSSYRVEAENQCETFIYELPQTGGPGAAWLYAAGELLITVSSACLLLRRIKRKRKV